MGIDLSDNYITVEISTCFEKTLFTQNKAMNNYPKFGRCFVGHSVYTFEQVMS
jgi:hypothetical protein